MKKYYKRIDDRVLDFKLSAAGAVQINGVKWCGKTSTAEQIANSATSLQDRQTSVQEIELAQNAPQVFLEGKAPKLIDEWQVAPNIWNQVRFEVDHRKQNGQFILTGSATPFYESVYNQNYFHSGVGRISPMLMRTMSLFETEDSSGVASLKNLFDNKKFTPHKIKKSLQDYAYLLCRGGWPRALGQRKKVALEQAHIFFEGLINRDIAYVFKNERNPERIKRLMRSYSRAISTETSIAEIVKDLSTNEGEQFDTRTVSS